MTTTTCSQSQLWNLREVARAKKGGFYFYGNYGVELLMVGGGGGGSSWGTQGNGGGGAGGIIYTNSLPVRAGTSYPITVGGGGGAGGANAGCGGRTCLVYDNGSGTCTNIIALGGGNGWAPTSGQPSVPNFPTPTSPYPAECRYYGSGGGGGSPRVDGPTTPGYNTCGGSGCQNCAVCWWGNLPRICGFGCPGGNAATANPPANPVGYGGGGGGASASGTSGSLSPCCGGSGGDGLCFAISGTSVGYAGGGGAGVSVLFTNCCGCSGGPSCGGTGAVNFGGSGWNFPGTQFCGPFGPEGQGIIIYNANATANRGGGGAAGFAAGPRLQAGGAAGGSGVVIIRYEGQQRGAGGSTVCSITSPTPATIHTFTGAGCFIA